MSCCLVSDQEKESRKKSLHGLKPTKFEKLAQFADRFLKLYAVSYGPYDVAGSLDEKPLFEKYFDVGVITAINSTSITRPIEHLFDVVNRYVPSLPADYDLKNRGSESKEVNLFCEKHGLGSHGTAECHQLQRELASRKAPENPKGLFGQRPNSVFACRKCGVPYQKGIQHICKTVVVTSPPDNPPQKSLQNFSIVTRIWHKRLAPLIRIT